MRAATGADDYDFFSDFRWTLLTHYGGQVVMSTPLDATKPEADHCQPRTKLQLIERRTLL